MKENQDCPSWVGETGREWWPDVVAEIKERGLLNRVSTTQVATYCQILGQFIDATEDLERNGFVVTVNTESSSYETINPKFSVQKDALSRLRQYWSDWGMTPKVVASVGSTRSSRFAGLVERLNSARS